MHKKTAIKLGAFVASAAATAALVGFAANGTGAYFSDTSTGHANISTGHVTVSVSGLQGIDFTNLLPGQYTPEQFTFQATGTGPEDIYLELPNDPALTAISAPGPAPLGRYGHFAVNGPAGNFSSFNLAADPSATPNPADTCSKTPGGLSADNVGQQHEATSTSDISNQYCPASKFILLAGGLTNGAGVQTASITFGYTGLLEDSGGNPVVNNEDSGLSQMPINVVAVEAGINPTDPRNGLS